MYFCKYLKFHVLVFILFTFYPFLPPPTQTSLKKERKKNSLATKLLLINQLWGTKWSGKSVSLFSTGLAAVEVPGFLSPKLSWAGHLGAGWSRRLVQYFPNSGPTSVLDRTMMSPVHNKKKEKLGHHGKLFTESCLLPCCSFLLFACVCSCVYVCVRCPRFSC